MAVFGGLRALCKHPLSRLGANLGQLRVNLGLTLGQLVAQLIKLQTNTSVFLPKLEPKLHEGRHNNHIGKPREIIDFSRVL